MKISHWSKISFVFDSLAVPRSVSSPTPAVSMKRTGPKSVISIAFLIGSVVVPLIFETMAVSVPVI